MEHLFIITEILNKGEEWKEPRSKSIVISGTVDEITREYSKMLDNIMNDIVENGVPVQIECISLNKFDIPLS